MNKTITIFALIIMLAAAANAADIIFKNRILQLDEVQTTTMNQQGGKLEINGKTTILNANISTLDAGTISLEGATAFKTKLDRTQKILQINPHGNPATNGQFPDTGYDAITLNPNGPAPIIMNGDTSISGRLKIGQNTDAAAVGITGTVIQRKGNIELALDSGNVGIGKQNPSVKLDVVGDITATGKICAGDVCLAEQTSIWTQNNNNNNIYYGLGNVGIGTNNPQAKLEVVTNPASDGIRLYSIMNPYSNTNSPYLAIGGYRGTTPEDFNFITEVLPTTAKLHITNSTGIDTGKLVTITKEGNIGIGTNNPQAKLEVTGDINATGDIISKGTKVCLADGTDCIIKTMPTLQQVTNSGSKTDKEITVKKMNVTTNMVVGGSLDIKSLDIKENLTVGGNINVNKVAVYSYPKGCYIQGWGTKSTCNSKVESDGAYTCDGRIDFYSSTSKTCDGELIGYLLKY